MSDPPRFHRGDRLRKARELAGLSHIEMATELDVHRGTITRWERNRGIRKLTVEAYAARTGVSFQWLWDGTEEQEVDRTRPT